MVDRHIDVTLKARLDRHIDEILITLPDRHIDGTLNAWCTSILM